MLGISGPSGNTESGDEAQRRVGALQTQDDLTSVFDQQLSVVEREPIAVRDCRCERAKLW